MRYIMQIKKYLFPNLTVNQMNMNFKIEIATTNPDIIVMNQLKAAAERINEQLKKIDRDFSPFRYDSLVSKFQRGDKSPMRFSNDFEFIYNSSVLAEQMTDGIYTSHFAGKYDPIKLVRSWAIEQAFDTCMIPMLKHPDIDGIWLSDDNQIKVATKQGSDFSWSIDIKDSTKTDEIVTTYYLKSGVISMMEIADNSGSHIGHNNVKQSIILGNSLTETGIWAEVSVCADIKKMAAFIEHYHLSGIMIDQQGDYMNFNNGTIANTKEIF